ncbi:MAG: hypothetical protein ACRDL7_11690, partial [Gaiellaceae bacterium]
MEGRKDGGARRKSRFKKSRSPNRKGELFNFFKCGFLPNALLAYLAKQYRCLNRCLNIVLHCSGSNVTMEVGIKFLSWNESFEIITSSQDHSECGEANVRLAFLCLFLHHVGEKENVDVVVPAVNTRMPSVLNVEKCKNIAFLNSGFTDPFYILPWVPVLPGVESEDDGKLTLKNFAAVRPMFEERRLTQPCEARLPKDKEYTFQLGKKKMKFRNLRDMLVRLEKELPIHTISDIARSIHKIDEDINLEGVASYSGHYQVMLENVQKCTSIRVVPVDGGKRMYFTLCVLANRQFGSYREVTDVFPVFQFNENAAFRPMSVTFLSPIIGDYDRQM